MGACCAGEAQLQDREVEKDLRIASIQDAACKKLLFLGSGGSGKSTIFKQLQTIHGKGYADDDRRKFVQQINHQIVSQITLVVDCLNQLQEQNQQEAQEAREADFLQLDEEKTQQPQQPVRLRLNLPPEGQKAAVFISHLGNTNKLTPEIVDNIKILWSEPQVKRLYERRADYCIFDTSAYFWDNIDRVFEESYIPNYQDILKVRFRTTGITEQKFSIEPDQTVFNVFDVGGQMSERKKWIHCFENVTAVIFVASLACYDKVMYERGDINQMVDTLELFDEICNSAWFRHTSFILFLNKRDLFEDKIKTVPITDCESFRDFNGDTQDYLQTVGYVTDKFDSLNRNSEQQIYPHVTCATDQDNVRKVFYDVQHVVLTRNLAASGFMGELFLDLDEEDPEPSPDADVGPVNYATNFRDCIKRGVQPTLSSLTVEDVFRDYFFDTSSKLRTAADNTVSKNMAGIAASVPSAKTHLLFPVYCYAAHKKNNYYLSVGLNSGTELAEYPRKPLNLICLVDRSSSMQSPFDEDHKEPNPKSKMQVSNEVIVDILSSKLTVKDRFGLITFESQAHILNEMQLLSEYNLHELKASIMDISPAGGTNFESAFLSAVELYNKDKAIDNDDKRYENRVLLITDSQPSTDDETKADTLLDLVHKYSEESPHIYTTFISLGSSFDTRLVKKINSTRGCNYYRMKSSQHFLDTIQQEFKAMVTPLAFNVLLEIVPQGSSTTIDQVYGAKTNIDRRQDRQDSSCRVIHIQTLFSSKKSSEQLGMNMKNGMILVKLRQKRDALNVEQKDQLDTIGVALNYEDRDGEQFANQQQIYFDIEGDNTASTGDQTTYFDNFGIRKAILLVQYIDMLREWVQSESKVEKLAVRSKHKQQFKMFSKHMQTEMEICQDFLLEREIDLLKQLSNK